MSIAGCQAQGPSFTMLTRGRATVSPKYAAQIDSLINDGITRRAMPGCRVLAVKDQNIIFDKSYGHLTYDSLQRVNDSTIYDIASVTKVAASSLLLMKLYDDHKIDLDKKLCYYFPGFTDNGATLRDALAHQAGLKSWIDIKRLEPGLSRQLANDPEHYDAARAREIILDTIKKQPLNEPGEYLYSDLSFYYYPLLTQRFYGMDYVDFLNAWFYNPLGIKPLFNPLTKYPKSRIAPTERDTIWRKCLIQGTVHDEAAAMMGGVSGHAGLFATAYDMAVIMQMILSGGEYGGIQFIRPETVRIFTSQAFEGNRRGLVFDKPVIDTTLNGTPSRKASYESFGHTGFTGTFVWADPKNNLILIFLCNSVHPNRSFMITRLDLRTKLHDIFYADDLTEKK